MKTLKEILLKESILEESLLDDEDVQLNNIDKPLYISMLKDTMQTAKDYDKLWKKILIVIKDKPIKNKEVMIKKPKNYILINRSSSYQKQYITDVMLYKPHKCYPLIREFEKSIRNGYLEYRIDIDDIMDSSIYDNKEIYELPKELEWLFEIK